MGLWVVFQGYNGPGFVRLPASRSSASACDRRCRLYLPGARPGGHKAPAFCNVSRGHIIIILIGW